MSIMRRCIRLTAIVIAVFLMFSVFVCASHKVVPHLLILDYYKKGKTYNAKITWRSVKGYTYAVCRKKRGGYKTIGKVKAHSSSSSFVNRKIGADKRYTYTVKQIEPKPSSGTYDKKGLKLIGHVKFNVDFQNFSSEISWPKVTGAKQYNIYRVRENGKKKRIGITKKTMFTDTYHKHLKDLKRIMCVNAFVDPYARDFSYKVRPYYSAKVNGVKKVSKGLCLPDGRFKLEPPVIVSLRSSKLVWSSVPNARYYRILQRNTANDSWSLIKKVKHKKRTVTQTTTLPKVYKHKYYAVQATGRINGSTVKSDIEKGFSLKDSGHNGISILFVGDSITYGKPYKSKESRHIFSYPNRIAQLTGVNYYNPSIPGATYACKDNKNATKKRSRIVTDVIEKMYYGAAPAKASFWGFETNSKGQANTKIEDYDIVFLASGTNDYGDNVRLGSVDSEDQTTFCGSVNKIMDYIEKSSINRMAKGESRIKVVFVDLFYSESFGENREELILRNDRDTKKNKLDLTIQDYQRSLNTLFAEWARNDDLELYKYNTRKAGIVDHNNIQYTTADRLHLTKYSYALYGNDMADFLVKKVF